jgi:hypothetical protein
VAVTVVYTPGGWTSLLLQWVLWAVRSSRLLLLLQLCLWSLWPAMLLLC